jgi:hypothetical protein
MTPSENPQAFPSVGFPIMAIYGYPPERRDGFKIPWEMILPHEKQAYSNHYQTLKRLAERGGLGAHEALAVLEDRPWRNMNPQEAYAELQAKLEQWLQARENGRSGE